jgi:hypothetical protein
MGCGCKKSKEEPVQQPPVAKVTITEGQSTPQDNVQLSPEQQNIFNIIVERLNESDPNS